MKPVDYNPNLIKIGKGTSQKERNELINLVKEYRDVFDFTYDELKAYTYSNILYHSNQNLKKSNLLGKS